MGCDCSDPKHGEEKLLNEAKDSKSKPVKRTPDSLSDHEEAGANGHSAFNSKQTDLTWYFDADDEKNEGDIVEKLCGIIGEKNQNEIETAISNVSIKDDINAVCRFLLNKASVIDIDFDASDKSKHECKENVNSCTSFIRITMVLEVYIKWIKTVENGKNDKNLYEFIDEALGKKQDMSEQQILNDFHHLMLNHNGDEDFEIIYGKLIQKQLIIAINKSGIIFRNYRDRNSMNIKTRKALYFGYTESKDVTLIKLCDRIYCFYAYSFDIGMRLRMKEKLKILYATDSNNKQDENKSDAENENENDEKQKTDAKLICMSSILKKKQINLVNVIGKNKIETNRYCTNNVNVNVNVNINEGVIFFYKDFEAKSEEKLVNEGKEYYERDWFIKPKYSDLKNELINNGKCDIDKSEFDDLQILAELQSKSDYNISLRQTMTEINSDSDDASWAINQKHILALMVYCNFESIQFELKQTYFRLNEKEEVEDLKKRHSIFGHLGRLLKEIVCEYGTECNQKSRNSIFYHSIDIKSISGTLIKCRAPISTSTSKVVLFNYSSVNGTIIELNSGHIDLIGGNKPKYFNCSLISDFVCEEETLFMAQKDCMLELSSIINISICAEYKLSVLALNIICTAFGDVNESWAEDRNNPFDGIAKKQKLKQLTKAVLERRGVTVQPHLFGKKKKKKKYKSDEKIILLQLLQQFAIYKKEMVLFWFSEKTNKIWPWIDELLEFMRDSCFCKDLKKDERKWVKLDLLSLFFSNLESVTIVDCAITESIVTDIDLFIQKLAIDPNEKYKKETSPDEDATKDESEVDKLLGIDIDSLVTDLHSDKSHISFKDPDFDDLCDYRLCKIKEIKILESYDENNEENQSSYVTNHIRRKFNKKMKDFGWQMVKDKIMGNNQGLVFRKIKN